MKKDYTKKDLLLAVALICLLYSFLIAYVTSEVINHYEKVLEKHNIEINNNE